LAKRLGEFAPELVGVTSLAEGADQLFAEGVLELGGSLEVVVPAARYRAAFGTERAAKRYDKLVSNASLVVTLPFNLPSDEAYMAAGREVVRRSDALLAVWDGKPARGYGGTADVVDYAKELDVPVEVVWPAGARRLTA
jgi:hypothetical protein